MNVATVPLKWGEFVELGFVPDKILLADCVYYSEVENNSNLLVSNKNKE